MQAQIKIKFTHEEACRRAAKALEIRRDSIISVLPTEGGRKFFVTYWVRGKYYSLDKGIATLTVWEIMEALPLDDVSGGVETMWERGVDSILKALGLEHFPKSERELKHAYRKMAKLFHPDVGGDESAFREIRAAYESALLMLPNLRRGNA
jgi:hypothetical protein